MTDDLGVKDFKLNADCNHQFSNTPRPLWRVDSAIDVLRSVISYAAWQAYESEGNGFSQGYDQMSDDFIRWVFDRADASEIFSEGEMRKALVYFSNFCLDEKPKGLIDLSKMNSKN